MRIAIVLITRWWRASIDLDGYGAALRRAGHEPSLVCLGNDAGEAEFPIVEAARGDLERAEFWRPLRFDAAICFNWLHAAPVVRALGAAGVRVISRADSDGRNSVRVFPRANWVTSVEPAQNPLDAARRIRHWARRYASLHRQEDRELLETVAASAAVAIETQPAADHLATILRHYHRADLAPRIHVVPHSVSEAFLHAPVPASRPPRIFCGGRWDDPQKDAALLARTIPRILRAHPDVEFQIAGPGTREKFAPLAAHPRVSLLDVVPQSRIPALLAGSQLLLASSRWESQPIGTLEALCLGASFAAPPLPGFLGLSEGGTFGTLASRRNPVGLAQASLTELAAWRAGRRSPSQISETWRRRVSNDAVVADLLALLP